MGCRWRCHCRQDLGLSAASVTQASGAGMRTILRRQSAESCIQTSPNPDPCAARRFGGANSCILRQAFDLSITQETFPSASPEMEASHSYFVTEVSKRDQCSSLLSVRKHPLTPLFLGVAAIAGAFTEKILKDMATFNERPIVFALSNPTSKAECTAEQCYRLTEVLDLSTGKMGAPDMLWPCLQRDLQLGSANTLSVLSGFVHDTIYGSGDQAFLKYEQGVALLDICLPGHQSFLSIHHRKQQTYEMSLLNLDVSFSLFDQGRGVFASGSPFSKVTLPNGQTFFPGQGNNAYVFPGVALGVIACGVRHISDDIFLLTAEVSKWQITTVLKNYYKGHMHLLKAISRS